MVGKPCLVVVVENPNQLKLNLKCPYWSYEVRLVCRSCLSQHICTVKCAHNENQQTKPEAQTSKLCSRKTHSIKIFLWRGICENNGKQGKGLSRWLSDAVGLCCPVRSTFVLAHIFCFCSYFCSYFVHIFFSYFLFIFFVFAHILWFWTMEQLTASLFRRNVDKIAFAGTSQSHLLMSSGFTIKWWSTMAWLGLRSAVAINIDTFLFLSPLCDILKLFTRWQE